jgi:hypothetical protein
VPALPGVRPPGPSQPGPPGNIGRLLPAISPSPVVYSPSGTGHVAVGRYDSVSMGPGTGPDASGAGTTVLAAVATAIVFATTGGWLAVSTRARKRSP